MFDSCLRLKEHFTLICVLTFRVEFLKPTSINARRDLFTMWLPPWIAVVWLVMVRTVGGCDQEDKDFLESRFETLTTSSYTCDDCATGFFFDTHTCERDCELCWTENRICTSQFSKIDFEPITTGIRKETLTFSQTFGGSRTFVLSISFSLSGASCFLEVDGIRCNSCRVRSDSTGNCRDYDCQNILSGGPTFTDCQDGIENVSKNSIFYEFVTVIDNSQASVSVEVCQGQQRPFDDDPPSPQPTTAPTASPIALPSPTVAPIVSSVPTPSPTVAPVEKGDGPRGTQAPSLLKSDSPGDTLDPTKETSQARSRSDHTFEMSCTSMLVLFLLL